MRPTLNLLNLKCDTCGEVYRSATVGRDRSGAVARTAGKAGKKLKPDTSVSVEERKRKMRRNMGRLLVVSGLLITVLTLGAGIIIGGPMILIGMYISSTAAKQESDDEDKSE